MWQNSPDQFRERKPKTGNQHLGDLDRAISQLREILGIDQSPKMTTAYLVELQAAVEVVGRAIKEERWAREGLVTRGSITTSPPSLAALSSCPGS
jgi:hypothetical protein